MTTTLETFLHRGLLDVGEDDTKIEQLTAAASDIAKGLISREINFVSSALTALDPRPVVDETAFAAVAEAVANHWSTYQSRFSASPQQLFRAVLWEGIDKATVIDKRLAGALAYLAENVQRFHPPSREAEAVQSVIARSANVLQEESEAIWGGATFQLPVSKASAKKKPLELALPKKIDAAGLATGFAAASGPSTADGTALKEPNPYWPNSPQQWSYEFAPRAAKAVARAVDPLLERMNDALAQIAEGMKHQSTTLQKDVERLFGGAIESLKQEAVAREKRLQLLWWKEALFSLRLKKSYRAVDAIESPFLLALDIADQVPEFCPISVEYFLRETATQVADTSADSPTLLEVARSLRESETARSARGSVDKDFGDGMRRPLAALIASGRVTDEQSFEQITGLPATAKLALPDLAAFLFRDLQAIRLATKAAD